MSNKNKNSTSFNYLRLYRSDGFIESWIVPHILPAQMIHELIGTAYVGKSAVLVGKPCFMLIVDKKTGVFLRENKKATKLVREAGTDITIYGPALVFDSAPDNTFY